MSRGKCIKPRATKRSESTLRGLVLVLVLAALLVPVAGWADIIPIQLTSGTLTLTGITPTGFWTHQALDVFAPDLAVHFTTGLGALGPGRCEPCFPGVVNSTSGDNSETVSGTATFHGVTNQVVGAGLSVTGSLFTMPLLILPSFFVVLPFTLHVQFCPNGSTSCATGIDASGSGQSEFHYDRHPVAGQPD